MATVSITMITAEERVIFERNLKFAESLGVCGKSGTPEQPEQMETRRKLILYLNVHVQKSITPLIEKGRFCAVLIHCITL